MKKTCQLSLLFMIALFLTSCAAGPNTVAHTPPIDGNIAGFWLGLWHGLIVVITFIISLFSDNVNVYEVHNNGGWYNFGFLIGAGCLLGGTRATASKHSRRKT